MTDTLETTRWTPEFFSAMRDAYKGRSVLIAGADGLLGISVTQALHTLGADVSVLTRREDSAAAQFAGRVIFGDFENSIITQKAIGGQSVIFDCVGSMSAVASMKDAVATFRQECQAHIAFFDACAKSVAAPIVIFPSTRLVYGTPRCLPVDETHPVGPTSNYGLAKLTVERFLKLANESEGLRSRVFRVSNPYAPQLKVDQCRYNVISRFALAIANGERVQIYGDGTQLRDYVHASDVVNAFLASGADEDLGYDIFNLGGPEAITVRDAVQVLVDTVEGPDPELVPWPDQSLAIETGNYYSDPAKLNSRYDLPMFVSPRSGLRELIVNYQKQRKGGRSNVAWQ